MRVGNRSRQPTTSLPGSCTAARTVIPTARPLVSSSPSAWSIRLVVARSANAVRVASSSMTTSTCGDPAPRDVLAHPLGGECLGAGVHDGDEVLQQVAHRLGGGVLEPGEQSPAGPQLHAALGVDRPHLHPPRRDGRGEPVEEGPDHRALPGPGGAGDEDVGAEQAEPPQGAVLAPAHRHPGQPHRLLGREGPDGLREGVAAVELDDRPPRGRGDQAGLAGAEAVRDPVEAVGDVVRGEPDRQPQPEPFDARRGDRQLPQRGVWPGPARPPRSWA